MKKNLNFGKRIAQLRRAKGLTQQMLGDQIGVSQRVIAYYEVETNNPPSNLLPKLAQALSVSIDDFFSNKAKKNGSSKNYNLWKKLRLTEEMDPKDQKAIMSMIDRLAKR